jgi:hypothetical protein
VLCLTAVILGAFIALGAPRLYERMLPVDGHATERLTEHLHGDLGVRIVYCLNQINSDGVWWHLRPAHTLIAHEDRGGSWSDSYYVITGRLGWHVTWAALVPYGAETPTAYETLGAEGDAGRSRFRLEIPIRIVGSFKRCGVSFGGIYPGELPLEK